jgi:hypothetical protein
VRRFQKKSKISDLDIVEEGHLEPLEIGLEPRLFEKYGAKPVMFERNNKIKENFQVISNSFLCIISII